MHALLAFHFDLNLRQLEKNENINNLPISIPYTKKMRRRRRRKSSKFFLQHYILYDFEIYHVNYVAFSILFKFQGKKAQQQTNKRTNECNRGKSNVWGEKSMTIFIVAE